MTQINAILNSLENQTENFFFMSFLVRIEKLII